MLYESCHQCDAVIAKGQGNHETLSEVTRPVWFVLMAKCSVIATDIGCDPGSLVLERRPAPDGPALRRAPDAPS